MVLPPLYKRRKVMEPIQIAGLVVFLIGVVGFGVFAYKKVFAKKDTTAE